ncbi:MAG: hypothetical protein RhofKO_41080 [Rhodothermales bacterium]
MRHYLPLLLVLCVSALPGFAQDRLTEADLEGTQWKLVIDIPADEADNALERVALKAVAGLMDEVKVAFRFRRDGELLVLTDAFGEKDGEVSTWSINERGALLMGDNETMDVDVDVWMLDGDRIVGYEKNGRGWDRKEGVYLEQLY